MKKGQAAIAGALVALSCTYVTAAVGCGGTATDVAAPTSFGTTTSVDSETPQQNSLRFGVSTPGGATATQQFEQVTAAAGQAPTLVLSYADFTTEPPIAGLDAVSEAGADPLLTWEPWKWEQGAQFDSARFAMPTFVRGDHDPYIARWAEQLRDWNKTVYLRFAHEQNGTWYPWSTARGTDPATYVAAWKHVHDIFRAAGATNVKWVWSPNVSFEGSTPMSQTYPGSDFVDVVGLDGYNWGTSAPDTKWTPPAELFGPSLNEVRAIAPAKPIVIAEVGSTDQGGSKPDWIRDLIAFLDAQPDVTAFVWFDHDKEADWRFTSTPDSAAAFAEALGRTYR